MKSSTSQNITNPLNCRDLLRQDVTARIEIENFREVTTWLGGVQWKLTRGQNRESSQNLLFCNFNNVCIL